MVTPSESGKGLEFRVGIFVLFGLIILGYMVVQFGRFGIGIKKSYPLTVELPNASGLIKNSKVLMSGALVGSVIDEPKVLDRARGVSVTIIVYDPIKVARNASVVVGSSGLLGDRFVDIIPKREDAGGYYQPGDTVQGTRAQGMEEIQREGGALVGDLRSTVATLNKTVTRIDQELLKEQTFKDLQAAMANLRVTTENFRATSEKLSTVIEDAHGVMAKAGDAMGGAKDTFNTAKAAAEDVRGAIGDARKVLGTVKGAADQAVHGNGLLPTLISDRQLSDNVSALMSNLRRNGILFYKDRPAPTPDPAAATPAPSPVTPRHR
jgi:phospholipid/cholesterol/gamma-HCH transport system substrate-binding protein